MGDQDPRWDFFQDFTLRTLNLKADKWGKLVGNDDQKQLILDFLEKKDKLWLIITAQGSGALTASEIPPESSKTKGVFFFKREEKTIPKDKIAELVSFGDLSQIPLDHLSSFVDDVVDGILSYNDNFATWPSVVSSDVQAHVHKLKSEVYEISGSVKGRTLLPMPAGVENVSSDGDLSHVLHKIEGIIIKWTHQVKSVLELKSGQALIDGKNPGPQEELKFWADLSSNLNCIYEQLVSSKVKKMGRILKEKDSSYFQSLIAMYDDVRIHLEEARDISMHLKPLNSLLDDIEQTDMSEVERKLSALYHLIALIWRSCDYYRTPARVVVLLQEVCNFIIEITKTFLDPENILKGELDESFEQVKIAQKVLTDFKRLYFEYREKLPTYFTDGAEPVLWDFRPVLVFHRFDRFAKRVDLLAEFFQSSLMLMNLEKVEIGGTRGQTLSAQVVVLFEEFQERI